MDQLKAELMRDQSEDPEFSIKQQLKNQSKAESNECKRLMEEIKIQEAAIANRKRILAEIAPDTMTSVIKEQKDMIRNVLRAEKQLQEWPKQKVELTANTNKLQQQTMMLLGRLPSPIQSSGDGMNDGKSVEQQLGQKTRELERLGDQEMKVLNDLRDTQNSV